MDALWRTIDFGRSRSALKRLSVRGFLFAWGASLSLAVAALMVGHWVRLPGPERNAALQVALAAATPSDGSNWQLVHVLYGECRCSQRIFSYLRVRPRPSGVREHVILVGASRAYAASVRSAGFGVSETSSQDLLSRFSVSAAPLLLLLNPDGEVLYSGGYTDHKQTLGFRDLALLARLRAGESVNSLPLFGCAVSADLQKTLDPFGIKY